MYSPSGAGKTSLIQAALIPRLQKMENIKVLPPIHVGRMPQQRAPDESNRYILSMRLSLDKDESSSEDEAILAGMSLCDYVEKMINPSNEQVDFDTVFIFDQFEEIFTLNPVDREAKLEFFQALGRILEVPRRWALFSMREEYLGSFEAYKKWIPGSLKVTYRLEPLEPEAALEAIQKPAEKAGVTFTADAANHIINELSRISVVELDGTRSEIKGQYIESVYLQVVCYHVWDTIVARSTVSEITPGNIPQERFVKQALEDFYMGAVSDAAKETGIEESQIRDWCEHVLITPMNTRNIVLRGPYATDGLPNPVVKALDKKLLIHVIRRGGAFWYELTHDRMIQAIKDANLPKQLKPTLEVFTEEALNKWHEDTAYDLSQSRRLRQALNEPLAKRLERLPPSLYQEYEMDGVSARLLFACRIFDKDIDFARQNLDALFSCLEGIWLTDVQRFKAYFIWEDNGDGWDPLHAENYYAAACQQITQRLHSRAKASKNDFTSIRQYLKKRYLTDDGKIDTIKNQQAKNLVERKAVRPGMNWSDAETYVKGFYENIIPAVVNVDLQAEEAQERAWNALQLLQSDKAVMANCLEIAVSIYFLQAPEVKSL
jgi:hypothetical protein